ncbi:CCA tRNA nucleotidyltransferase, partial [Candidatus Bathyarchaeota archaeon]|nr:CCA tRNA nucleotidyltransferase [Candidatus Bathyarchaeota archaeon]
MTQTDEADSIEKVCQRVLKEITPKKTEREKTLQFSKNLADKLVRKLQSMEIRVEVHCQGSIAKDTWLAGEKDIDMFIAVPKNETKEVFQRVLDVVKSFVGKNWIESYAEHPYIEATVEGYKVDFVPCFKIKSAEEAGSSVDRTPLHTAYITKHLNQQTKNEIRLLKRFMQGIDAYGAEIKVKGFSGYLCELLVIYYGSFLRTLQEMSAWRFDQVIDVENHYKGQIKEMKRLFNAPLVVIDPVDTNRNVAAAVSRNKMGEVIMASRLFVAKPDSIFFSRDKIAPLSQDDVKKKLENLGFDLVFVVFQNGERVPDILWGELYKTALALQKVLSQHDFQVVRESVWSDERK